MGHPLFRGGGLSFSRRRFGLPGERRRDGSARENAGQSENPQLLETRLNHFSFSRGDANARSEPQRLKPRAIRIVYVIAKTLP